VGSTGEKARGLVRMLWAGAGISDIRTPGQMAVSKDARHVRITKGVGDVGARAVVLRIRERRTAESARAVGARRFKAGVRGRLRGSVCEATGGGRSQACQHVSC